MAISLKHNFQSAVADEGDTSLVRPSNWNAEHDLTLATSRLVGRTTAGTGSAEEISVGTGLNLSSGSLSVSSTTPQVNAVNTFTNEQIISVNSSSLPGLRITQTGTADALRIEDETSPDATPFVITADGHAIAGYGSALTIQTVVPQFQSHTATLDEGGFGGVDWGNTATGQVNWFGKSRGGSYGTQAIVQNNDTIGDFRFYGSDGVALIQAARIEVDVDGTPGVNDMPGRIGFFTTPDGATVPTEKMRIANDGTVTITGTGVINAASANDGLRITQAGSGNALVVEDSTNPDSTPFIVKADGKVGIGEDAPTFYLQVAAPNASTQTQMGVTSADYTSDFKSVYTVYSGASTTGTTYGITNAELGSIRFQNVNNALIGTNGGTPLIFATTSLERMRISSAGNVGIGTTSPGYILDVSGESRIGSALISTNPSTGSAVIELGGNRTGDGNSFIDFHSSPGTDYESRVIRGPGLDGNLNISNLGTGNFNLIQTNSAPIIFLTDNAERFRIAPSGQLGIGGANYGTAGQVLTSNGAGAAPSWAAVSGGGVSRGQIEQQRLGAFT